MSCFAPEHELCEGRASRVSCIVSERGETASTRTVFAVSTVSTCERIASITVLLAAGAMVSSEREESKMSMSEPRGEQEGALPSPTNPSSAGGRPGWTVRCSDRKADLLGGRFRCSLATSPARPFLNQLERTPRRNSRAGLRGGQRCKLKGVHGLINPCEPATPHSTRSPSPCTPRCAGSLLISRSTRGGAALALQRSLSPVDSCCDTDNDLLVETRLPLRRPVCQHSGSVSLATKKDALNSIEAVHKNMVGKTERARAERVREGKGF